MGKRLFVAGCIGLGLLAGLIFSFWQRATQLPDWYTANSAVPTAVNVQNAEQVDQQRQTVTSKIDAALQAAGPNQAAEVDLAPSEVNSLLTSELRQVASKSNLTPAIAGINTQIRDGKLESGAVLDLSKIQPKQLSNKEQQAVTQALKAFPGLGDRPVYIGIAGIPRVENGQLVVDDSARIKLGDLSFTLPEVAARLGIPAEKLQERINLELELGNLRIQDAKLVGDRLIVRGTAIN